MNKKTLITHHPEIPLPEGNRSVTSPIYQTVKFTFDRFADFEKYYQGAPMGYVYSSVSNPTVKQLETLVSTLQDRDDAIATSTGIAAITCSLLSLLQAGDHVIMFLESYKPSRTIVRKLLSRFNIESSLVSVEDEKGLLQAIRPGKTRVLLFESPTNPTTRIVNIEKITRLAKESGFFTVIDNTFAGFHNHGQYEVDVYLHSLSKFAGGHGDVQGGAIIANKDLIGHMKKTFNSLGCALAPMAAFLILRGIKTYYLRYEKQCENAHKTAEFLHAHPKVKTVLYPGLSSHPDHELAKKQMSDFGSILAFDLMGSAQNAREFLERLQLITIAPSLGSTESLAAPAKLFYGRDLTEAEQALTGLHETTVRLALGVEAIDDLIADISQALDVVARQ